MGQVERRYNPYTAPHLDQVEANMRANRAAMDRLEATMDASERDMDARFQSLHEQLLRGFEEVKRKQAPVSLRCTGSCRSNLDQLASEHVDPKGIAPVLSYSPWPPLPLRSGRCLVGGWTA
jgi:hypothetical protein